MRMASVWLWEVAELGATVRKADREKLKQFISRESVRERKAYGRRDTVKPALANFVGTINNESGFLQDATGYRRFMVVPLQSIDWDYVKYVDINQLWAQALALWEQGEDWHLTTVQHARAEEIAKEFEIEDPVSLRLERALIDGPANFIPTMELLTYLRLEGTSGSEKYLASSIAQYMKAHDYESTRGEFKGKRVRGYKGAMWTKEADTLASSGIDTRTFSQY